MSLRGLTPLVVAQMLVGLQQRCRRRAPRPCDAARRSATTLRRQRVATLADCATARTAVWNSPARYCLHWTHAGGCCLTRKLSRRKDDWDLAVFGHNGRLSFTAITQAWLREAAKRWAAEEPAAPSRRPAPAWRCATTIGAWRGCRRVLRTRADGGNTQQRWAALTWRLPAPVGLP